MAIEGAGNKPQEVAAKPAPADQADRATVARKVGEKAGAAVNATQETAAQIKDKVQQSVVAKGLKKGIDHTIEFFKPGVQKTEDALKGAGERVAASPPAQTVKHVAEAAVEKVKHTAKDLSSGYKDGHADK